MRNGKQWHARGRRLRLLGRAIAATVRPAKPPTDGAVAKGLASYQHGWNRASFPKEWK
jgi:hypothetical protein